MKRERKREKGAGKCIEEREKERENERKKEKERERERKREKERGFRSDPNCLKHPATGWRRLIGSPKVWIIFHKRATKYRSLLRKRTYKDKGSYESSPLCSPGQTLIHDGAMWVVRV